MKTAVFVCALALTLAELSAPGAVAAQAAPGTPTLASLDPAKIPQMIVNDPSSPSVNKAKAQLIDDPDVTGGKALRVQVPGKSGHPWDSMVSTALKKPIKKGDRLLLVFWAKLVQGENGATTTTLPWNAVSLTSPPWSAVFGGPADIGSQWKQIELTGKADKDYAPADLSVGCQLATAKQTIDFGPIILLDLGQ